MRWLMPLAATVLAACTTVGSTFDVSRVDELRPGVSTRDDAMRLLGQPTSESAMPQGAALLQWQYVRGTVVGGSGAHVAILFDQAGVMVRVTQRTVIR